MALLNFCVKAKIPYYNNVIEFIIKLLSCVNLLQVVP